jgi:hypothetical protein
MHSYLILVTMHILYYINLLHEALTNLIYNVTKVDNFNLLLAHEI